MIVFTVNKIPNDLFSKCFTPNKNNELKYTNYIKSKLLKEDKITSVCKTFKFVQTYSIILKKLNLLVLVLNFK